MSKPLKIACFGEILWDVFPDTKRLGGAPLNVALRLQSYGAEVAMISAIGKDTLGDEALAIVTDQGLNISHIQRNKKSTGAVQVTLDTKGAASYEIGAESAWDHILVTKENKTAVAQSDALILGSLAFRESVNIATLEQLLEEASFVVFDLNLRPPHYDIDVVFGLMDTAHMIKMNDEELELIVSLMDLSKDTMEDELKAISEITNTPTICVTLGPDGAMLLHQGTIFTQTGFPTTVVDTVGAGDSFLATLIFGLLSKEHPKDAIEVACAVGSIVANKAGANPPIAQEEIDELLP